MYSKGQEGLRNIEITLASLRKGGRQESRQVVKRGVTTTTTARKDNHNHNNDNDNLLQSQREAKDQVLLSHNHSSFPLQGMTRSKSVGVEIDVPASVVPPWYEGQYTPAESTHHNNNKNKKKQDVVAREKKDKSIEKEVEEDVEERVSQAERTLYPLLLAAVADYSIEREGAAVGNSSSDSNNNVVVVEWDESGAPRRLRSTWIPNNPIKITTTMGMGEVRQYGQSEQRVESSNSNSSSSKRNDRLTLTGEQTRSIAVGSNTRPLDFNEACNQLYEYNPKHNSLKSIVLGTQKNVSRSQHGRSRGDGGITSTRIKITNSHSPSISISSSTNRNRKLPMSTEGIVIAENSASSIAKKIRLAVQGQYANIKDNDEEEGDKRRNSRRVSLVDRNNTNGNSPIPLSTPEPEKEVVFFTEVVKPLTAFFCSGCHTCTPRDVSTGLPDKCPSCGETFEEMPEMLPPPPSTSGGTVERYEKNRKKQTTSTSTVTTTTTNDAATSTVNDSGDVAAVGTQMGTTPKLLSLDETVHGLYFLHLWDQITSEN
ncbi:hypothetical protein LSM04_006759 [Trypanosoma melophagium]|uniref:uncharacterized protein n=1 Tax=Trypanosoma melophagium TaxID=715481 RepID=UPI00351A13F1|nr:hypothetical protein LSM04_006759 [Trypanosoma melophagium]